MLTCLLLSGEEKEARTHFSITIRFFTYPLFSRYLDSHPSLSLSLLLPNPLCRGLCIPKMTGLRKVMPGGPRAMTGLSLVCLSLSFGRSLSSRIRAMYTCSDVPFLMAPSGTRRETPESGITRRPEKGGIGAFA